MKRMVMFFLTLFCLISYNEVYASKKRKKITAVACRAKLKNLIKHASKTHEPQESTLAIARLNALLALHGERLNRQGFVAYLLEFAKREGAIDIIIKSLETALQGIKVNEPILYGEGYLRLPLGHAIMENWSHVIIFLTEQLAADWHLVYGENWISALEAARLHVISPSCSGECDCNVAEHAKYTVRTFSNAIAGKKRELLAALSVVLTRDPSNIIIYYCFKNFPTFDFDKKQWVSDRLDEKTAVDETAEKLETMSIAGNS